MAGREGTRGPGSEIVVLGAGPDQVPVRSPGAGYHGTRMQRGVTAVVTPLGDYLQTADWKEEKHVPVIELVDDAKKGETFRVHLCVGSEIPHPHTTEHHIRWIKLFFQPQGEKFTVHLGSFVFEAHAESVQGANEGPAKCEPCVHTSITLEQPGKLMALSYCNIHGLWENEMDLELK